MILFEKKSRSVTSIVLMPVDVMGFNVGF